jgi:hypothetical protein
LARRPSACPAGRCRRHTPRRLQGRPGRQAGGDRPATAFLLVGRDDDLELTHKEAAYYKTVQLPVDEIDGLRAFLDEQIEALIKEHRRERESQERRLRKLKGERQKLLHAHYADAILLDLLKTEQVHITAEIASAEGRLAAVASNFQDQPGASLERALTGVGDCAPPTPKLNPSYAVSSTSRSSDGSWSMTTMASQSSLPSRSTPCSAQSYAPPSLPARPMTSQTPCTRR